MTTAFDFSATTIDGAPAQLAEYRGKVMLVVNTASKCGFTSQFEGLEKLYRDFAFRGLVVLGFPCDQFGNQEPGDEEEIKNFCSLTYDVTFPMFSKIDVNGGNTHPFYEWLRQEKGGMLGNQVKWNFTKFLINADGEVVGRYPPAAKPEDIASVSYTHLTLPTN